MNKRCLVALGVSLSLGLSGSAAYSQTGPKPGVGAAKSAAPVAQAEALGLAMADAVEKSADCSALGPNLDAALAAHSSDIQALSASKAADSGSLSADNQKRLLAMAQKVKGCAGQVKSPALDNLKAAFAHYERKAKSVKRESSVNCREDCCVKGWETWALVAFYSTACLGGSNQSCCMAVTIASYDACMELYCPTNNCCRDVPVSLPRKQ